MYNTFVLFFIRFDSLTIFLFGAIPNYKTLEVPESIVSQEVLCYNLSYH